MKSAETWVKEQSKIKPFDQCDDQAAATVIIQTIQREAMQHAQSGIPGLGQHIINELNKKYPTPIGDSNTYSINLAPTIETLITRWHSRP